jgi:hypothetical protein
MRGVGEGGPYECGSLHERRLRLHGMNHSLRLSAMAEALGAGPPEWRGEMLRKSENEREKISGLEEQCR